MRTKGRGGLSENANTPQELAAFLRIDRRRIYEAIAKGELRSIYLGNGYRILPADRDAWIETLVVAARERAKCEPNGADGAEKPSHGFPTDETGPDSTRAET